jgi:hypothetical protein
VHHTISQELQCRVGSGDKHTSLLWTFVKYRRMAWLLTLNFYVVDFKRCSIMKLSNLQLETNVMKLFTAKIYK